MKTKELSKRTERSQEAIDNTEDIRSGAGDAGHSARGMGRAIASLPLAVGCELLAAEDRGTRLP